MFLAEILSIAAFGVSSQQTNCPYDCSVSGICAASLSSMAISSESRRIYCSTENYDNCPVFLAKSLRRR